MAQRYPKGANAFDYFTRRGYYDAMWTCNLGRNPDRAAYWQKLVEEELACEETDCRGVRKELRRAERRGNAWGNIAGAVMGGAIARNNPGAKEAMAKAREDTTREVADRQKREADEDEAQRFDVSIAAEISKKGPAGTAAPRVDTCLVKRAHSTERRKQQREREDGEDINYCRFRVDVFDCKTDDCADAKIDAYQAGHRATVARGADVRVRIACPAGAIVDRNTMGCVWR